MEKITQPNTIFSRGKFESFLIDFVLLITILYLKYSQQVLLKMSGF
jgi:hypothetical protein